MDPVQRDDSEFLEHEAEPGADIIALPQLERLPPDPDGAELGGSSFTADNRSARLEALELVRAAVELADRLEAEGYGVIRRWSFVIAGCADEEQARALAEQLHGEVEAGGEMVYESMPQNPFRFFGGLADV